jgi:hypothetical protein
MLAELVGIKPKLRTFEEKYGYLSRVLPAHGLADYDRLKQYFQELYSEFERVSQNSTLEIGTSDLMKLSLATSFGGKGSTITLDESVEKALGKLSRKPIIRNISAQKTDFRNVCIGQEEYDALIFENVMDLIAYDQGTGHKAVYDRIVQAVKPSGILVVSSNLFYREDGSECISRGEGCYTTIQDELTKRSDVRFRKKIEGNCVLPIQHASSYVFEKI